jgi:predicted PurR-regulated permease PerM
VLIALVLAYLFDPLISYAQRRWRWPRRLTITLVLVTLSLVLAGLLLWLVPLLFNQSIELAQSVRQWLGRLAERWTFLQSFLDEVDFEQHLRDLQEDPMGRLAPVIRAAFAGTGKVAEVIGSVLGTGTYVVLSLVLIPIYFFVFAWKFGPIVHSVDAYIPASRRERVKEIAGKMNAVVAGFVRGRLVIALIMCVLFSLGWWLAGVPYALIIGIAAGILSLIPFVGGIAWPIAVLLAYMQEAAGGVSGAGEATQAAQASGMAGFDWLGVFVWPTVVYAAVQFVEGWVLTPWIQGKSTNLDTVTVIIVVFIGGAVGGLYGLLLCIPIAACVKIFLTEVALPKLRDFAASH